MAEAAAAGIADVAGLEAEQEKVGKVIALANQAAIKNYLEMKQLYPSWFRNSVPPPAKSAGCVDEVAYHLAYELEKSNDLDNARSTLLALIQRWPESTYVPHAYLAFGELFFAKAQGDPSQWRLAEQSYGEVVKYPAPENWTWGLAEYRLGQIQQKRGDGKSAASGFRKAIDFGDRYGCLPGSIVLAATARRELAAIAPTP